MTDDVPVLLVEDNQGDATLIRRVLDQSSVRAFVGDISLVHVETMSACLDKLADGAYDVLLLDLGLEATTGLATVERVFEHHPNQAVIVLTGLDNDEMAIDAIRAGAQDYLPKDDIDADRLMRALRYAVERSKQERELQRRTEQMEFFNSILRHDLLNGMNVVQSRASMLSSDLSGEREQYAETILRWSNNIVDLTRKVRSTLDTLTTERPTELEPVALAPVVGSQADRVRSMDDDDVTIDVDCPDGASVMANDLFGDVLGNLLTNSVEHGGDAIAVTVAERAGADAVRITVDDDGPGIPEDRRSEVFERGNKGASSSGTGFGLFFVRAMVSSYGGEVWAENGPDGGARFVIELPQGPDSASTE
ncbi:hybrid sensor histidine kinase/response regulator [Halomicrobium urmianum]|uniref:hybrid sensor histidine kinase/response regulator n=1 Tax=Halomicrobium urmianum TaxID=1586233 RepID=UPI001CDA27A7|nr:hybrid sensor histidine kinase/response regulator [Halomicrobium urmianum]